MCPAVILRDCRINHYFPPHSTTQSEVRLSVWCNTHHCNSHYMWEMLKLLSLKPGVFHCSGCSGRSDVDRGQ